MVQRSRLGGVTRSVAAAAAILLIAAGCNGSAGGSATPTPGASASPATAGPGSSPTSGPTTPSTAGADGTPLEVLDFTLEPLALSVQGPDVVLDVSNAGPTVHNLTIRDDAGAILAATRDLRDGEGETIEADLPAGSYVMFCSLPGHESLGMKGTLTVTTP